MLLLACHMPFLLVDIVPVCWVQITNGLDLWKFVLNNLHSSFLLIGGNDTDYRLIAVDVLANI